jgi:hypothetical protein
LLNRNSGKHVVKFISLIFDLRWRARRENIFIPWEWLPLWLFLNFGLSIRHCPLRVDRFDSARPRPIIFLWLGLPSRRLYNAGFGPVSLLVALTVICVQILLIDGCVIVVVASGRAVLIELSVKVCGAFSLLPVLFVENHHLAEVGIPCTHAFSIFAQLFIISAGVGIHSPKVVERKRSFLEKLHV